MKIKFWVFTFLLLFARGCDFYSTSLWFFQPGGMSNETNPLTRYLGVGWDGLLLSNILIISLILAAFYFYSFRYKRPKLDSVPNTYFEYASQLYFKRKDRFYWLLFKTPKRWRPYISHFGYVTVRTIIIGSLLATIHNLCQFYQVPIYDSFRGWVKRPLFVIYGLIVLSFVGFYLQLIQQEYKEWREG